MADSADRPGCLHHVHVTVPRGDPDPSLVCSCPAGLIHMHDCPVLLGLDCVHFRASEQAELLLDDRDFDKLHSELMQDFLSRTYAHRVRSLAAVSDAWELRREDLLRRYAEEWEDEGDGEVTPEEEERYVTERERLIERRRVRDQERAEREQKSREEKAVERAKMGIKTVVEKARESIAARGNVSESMVDDLELPPGEARGNSKRRRRRRKSGAPDAKRAAGGGAAESPGGPPAAAPDSGGEGGGKPKRRRRRRRRPPGGKAPGGKPPGSPA
jgi:hypothetical protein